MRQVCRAPASAGHLPFEAVADQAVRDEWLSVPQVAGHLGLTMHTVRTLIDHGELDADVVQPYPGPKSRRRAIRVRRQDVDEFIERARIKPGELTHLYPTWPGDRYR